MKLSELQIETDQWIKSIGVRYFNELTNTVILSEEVGELSSLMARIYGEQSFKEKTSPEEAKAKLSEEMADILFVLACLANQTGIDLETAFASKMKKRTSRDKYRHSNNPKLQ